jgi:hypothetical protein
MQRCASARQGGSPADLGVQRARRDLLDQILERRPHEIFQFAGIGGQADRSGNRLHWAEIVERPFVADQSGREDRGADLATPGCARPKMKESCLTDLRRPRIGAPTRSKSALKIGLGATGRSVVLFSHIVQECIVFNRLELALSEKQMPRFVGIVSS